MKLKTIGWDKNLTPEEWDEVSTLGAGVREYKGLNTLFYNGEVLCDDYVSFDEYYIYDKEVRQSLEAIIVLPGVTTIEDASFVYCEKVVILIMPDSVTRILNSACYFCKSLFYVRLSNRLEFLDNGVFAACFELYSIFIPPSCTQIGVGPVGPEEDDGYTFNGCSNLLILHVPQDAQLGPDLVVRAKFLQFAPFLEDNEYLEYSLHENRRVNEWIKNINQEEGYELHRACSSFNPMADIIIEIMKRQGPASFQKKNVIGVTPLQYLEENPYASIKNLEIIKKYIFEMTGIVE